MTLSHCIDILPYILICIANPFSVRVLCMCVCVCMRVLCMRVHRFGYTYTQVSSSALGYVKIYNRSRLQKILSQYPLEKV